MKPLRHRSPNTKNAYTSNLFQSPNKKQANIIDFENQEGMINNRKFNLSNNHLSFNYNKDNYNYYDEITNAFNFITYVLKQKDSQIQELKLKIEDLERQLNEINETNMMTFNNKEIIDSSSSSNTYNLKFMKNSKKNTSPDSIRNKNKIMMNNLWKIENEISNNNSNNNSKIINLNKKNNFENELYKNNINNQIMFDNNNINIIHKIKNSTNIHKINNYNYRNITETRKFSNNNINYNYNNNIMNEIPNKNINEHSNDKKNINKIRKESYHSNQNMSIRNKNGSPKQINNNNDEQKNFAGENENLVGNEKIKIVALDNSLYNSGRPGSKSNSFNMSDDNSMITSKNDVKNYLKEVKNKLEPERFKNFISHIKALTKNKNIEEKNIIILQIKSLLIDRNLINKFENIMKVTKN